MKKYIIMIMSIITLLTGCSKRHSVNNYKDLTVSPSITPTIYVAKQAATPTPTQPPKDSWDYLRKNYSVVSYDQIVASDYNEQYVIIDCIIDDVEHDELANRVSFYTWFYSEKGYIREQSTIEYSNSNTMKDLKNIKDGDNVRICVYINKDTSFGSQIIGIDLIENIVTLQDIETSYINSCNNIDYTEFLRHPKKYWGDRVGFTGTVFQVIETEHSYDVILNNDDEYIFVSLDNKKDDNRILEGDSITVYGVFYKLYSYTNMLGINQTIPEIVDYFYK
uniref:Prokaryotic membrane lipoprotein lipid attachment site n=1 Tax=Caudovirales sp. ctCiv1 TaxID=2826769 RepID=A0A8S5M8I5_9CAUD|nr:hypothetical protein [uncultured Lachnoclostridium sp.]DAD78546.1 MAG TPA: Prokaryotic membrane lipoprotein lipid attachment site [Caudovirales sp. ctCiv1]